VTFRPVPPPTPVEVAEVAWDTCRRTRLILGAVGLATDSPTPRPSGLYETDFSEATAA